jgi:hypothetical protein
VISVQRFEIGAWVSLASLAWAMVSLGFMVRFWRRKYRQPDRGRVYERRQAARSWTPLLSMYVGLLGFDVGSYLLSDNLVASFCSIAVISAMGSWALVQRRRWLRAAQAAEDEEVSKVVIPDRLPRDF